jgi:predicted CXXCH cytochrome family protein
VLHEPYQGDCAECHDKGLLVGVEKCLACHEEIGEKINAVHNHQTNKSGNGCVNCHSPHASDFKNLLRNNQASLCRNCHADTWANYVDMPFKHPDNTICSNCHGVHGSSNLAMLKFDGNTVCETCHEAQGNFTHPVGPGVIDPRNGQIMTCVTCHYPHGTLYEKNLKLSGSMELCIQCHKSY